MDVGLSPSVGGSSIHRMSSGVSSTNSWELALRTSRSLLQRGQASTRFDASLTISGEQLRRPTRWSSVGAAKVSSPLDVPSSAMAS